MNGEHKITSSHRDRAALVYPRQSSMAQLREHTESTRSQYALADKAAALGWPRTSIEVVDTDLGISGKWGVPREGFTELVTRVCSGEVGAIFAIEITRLARSNADVARLAEFARITGTLLIDPDGVYDPADVNDRVLLGFKGTMGEMELHVMAQRLQANKRAAAGRGELRTSLPVGLVHDDAGDIVIDPDAEVQAAIRDVFAAFAACGSAYGVVAAFKDRRFPLRAYGGAWAGQLRWGKLTHARVLGVLKNPCYAGAYVHGRYTSRRTVDPGGTVHTVLVQRPRAEWLVLIKDHHEGYITWAEYLASEARLTANRTNAGARPPREGCALCQGIIFCGSCGKPMRTSYHTDARPSVLNAVYEVDFRGFSYGFRPGRGPHRALDALAVGIERKKVNWVLDADIRDFFGQLDRGWLMKFLRHRIADERVLRLISKWLAAGVIEDGEWAESEKGSPQGASVSPLLANVYLHVRHEC